MKLVSLWWRAACIFGAVIFFAASELLHQSGHAWAGYLLIAPVILGGALSAGNAIDRYRGAQPEGRHAAENGNREGNGNDGPPPNG